MFNRDRQQSRNHRASCCHHVAPIQIHQRRFGEKIEVRLEVLQGLNSGRRPFRLLIFRIQWHEILRIAQWVVSVSSADAKNIIAFMEQGDRVDIKILDGFMLAMLRKTLTKLSLELIVGRHDLLDIFASLFVDEGDKFFVRHRKARQHESCRVIVRHLCLGQ